MAIHGGAMEADPPSLLSVKLEGFDPAAAGASHHRDFVDAVKSRVQPLASAETGHRTATICHLNNIAMELGEELNWDPTRELFEGNAKANERVMPTMRPPYLLPGQKAGDLDSQPA